MNSGEIILYSLICGYRERKLAELYSFWCTFDSKCVRSPEHSKNRIKQSKGLFFRAQDPLQAALAMTPQLMTMSF